MQSNPNVLASVALVAAGAVIVLSLTVNSVPVWLEIGLLIVGIVVATGALGALVRTLTNESR